MLSKTVIITGAAGQLGLALIEKLESQGFNVVSVDICDLPRSNHYVADITNENEVLDLVAQSKPLALVNNAGIGVFSDLLDRTREEFYKVVDVNLWGTFNITKAFLSQCVTSQSYSIVNIGSIYGKVSSDRRIYGDSGRNNSEIYSMTKAGVLALTRHVATHYSHLDLRCNSVSPGGIYRAQTMDFVNAYENKVPLNKMADTGDITGVVGFLLSDAASYINGQDIAVDGGFTAW